MSTNISKQKREDLLAKINKIRTFISSAPQDENTGNLLSYLSELEKDVNSKKYGLVFEEHREGIDEILDTHIPVLSEEQDLFIANGGQMNFLIEGDNLAALEILEKTHKNKIDFIYIDPPYNTKVKDFIYDDCYVEQKDEYLHSKWLSFMEKRLRIAREVMSENACILISINENEGFGLKLLCDDVFGHENYLTCFAVKVRHEDRILKADKDFHEVFEYLLFYRKSTAHKTNKRTLDNTSIDDYIWKIVEVNPPSTKIKMGSKEVSVFAPEDYSLIKCEPNMKNLKRINIRGSIKEGNSSGRFFMRYLNGYIGEKKGFMYRVPDMGDDGIGYRYFLIPEGNRKNGDYFQGVPQNRSNTKEIPYPNIIRIDADLLDFEADFNKVGYEGEVEFRNGKKPIAFLQHCFKLGGLDKRNLTVLDFFAGSGSTAHALLDYMNNNQMNHKFILCTNNENNICRDITYERIKRVITKENYKAGLKYYKIDYLPINERMYYEYANELLAHIRELVELENGINIDGNTNVAIVLTEEELVEFLSDKEKVTACQKIYIGHDVLPDFDQQNILDYNQIEINIIPDYYYRDLQEGRV